MLESTFAAFAFLVMLAQPGDANRYSSNPVLERCVVKLQDDIKLAAREPGVIIHLTVEEGSQVRAGEELGKIDDSEPKIQREAAGYAYSGAKKRAEDDVEIRFREAAARVAEAEYQGLLEANRRSPGAFSDSDVRKAKLEHTKALLGIEKTAHDQELAKFEMYTKGAEYKAADLAIKRRVIVAPFDGEVVMLYRKQDEWVSPGDPVLRLVRLDTMNVEGSVDQKLYDPHEVRDCEVTVVVEMARGRKETLKGRIKSVSPLVDLAGMYRVRAEVANRQQDGRWLLRDGLPATMTIHLGTAATNTADASRPR
jgi:multidrug efflux pump subunit AcrA (membrane-fusion protein)